MDGSGPAWYPPEKAHFGPKYGQKIIESTTVGLEGWDQAQNVGIKEDYRDIIISATSCRCTWGLGQG